ncbi:hypothetical protein [Pararhizobium sp.]|uniref:hypothetical protein n=1 Tax=Pararhizobium sp. TaxID=1977563 RepID=UPI00271BF398|nr:hypothetical protein [Pararhizobium sp.]MDO9417297.1 hypothetical protein [Pararhizobium sp.]
MPMRTILKTALVLSFAVSVAIPALAASGAQAYSNPRFGYTAEIPPNFVKLSEAGNGDGATFRDEEDKADLLVFGTNLGEESFSGELKGRIRSEKDDGWALTYEKVTDGWASYSGTKGATVVYARAIALCDGNAALFRIEYPKEKLKAFDAIVEVMVKALKPAEGCVASGAAPAAQ